LELTELIGRVVPAFERHRVPFLVIGGLAVSAWVSPRLTDDIDIVVIAKRKDSPRLKPALLECGARVTAIEMRWLFERRFVIFRIADARLDVHVSSSAHDRAAFANAEWADFGKARVRVSGPEDLILYKLAAWRPVDRADVHSLLTGVKDIALEYIEKWLPEISKHYGVDAMTRWKEARAEAGR